MNIRSSTGSFTTSFVNSNTVRVKGTSALFARNQLPQVRAPIGFSHSPVIDHFSPCSITCK